jgi:lipopolysaccharide transport system ATP-binding protein
LRARGTTILFVSHDTSDIKALCERCLWLQGGVVQELGEADDVVQQYLIATTRKQIAHAGAERIEAAAAVDTLESNMTLEGSHRYGDRRAIIVGAELLGPGRRAACTLNPEDRVEIRVRFQVAARIDSLIAGFLVRNSKGENIFGSNTARENYPVPAMTAGQTHTIEFHWTMPELPAAIYTISLGLADGDIEHSVMSDYVDDAITFTLVPSGERDGTERRGYFHLRCAAVSVHSHIGSRT